MLIKRQVFNKMIKAYPGDFIDQATIVNGEAKNNPYMYNFFDTVHDPENKKYYGEDSTQAQELITSRDEKLKELQSKFNEEDKARQDKIDQEEKDNELKKQEEKDEKKVEKTVKKVK